MTAQPSFPKALFASLALLAVFVPRLGAGQQESATLQATILPGALEIETGSVALVYDVGSFQSTDQEQVDAIEFQISGLVLNDLNSDGLGWRLSATPEPLVMGAEQLQVGSIAGFTNFGEAEGLSTPVPGELLCARADAIAGLTVDYGVRYTIPAFASAGQYKGKVTFSIVAE